MGLRSRLNSYIRKIFTFTPKNTQQEKNLKFSSSHCNDSCFVSHVCRVGVKPSCYVSYQTANNPWTCTEIVDSSNDPVWCHENDCRLSSELLTSGNSVCCNCYQLISFTRVYFNSRSLAESVWLVPAWFSVCGFLWAGCSNNVRALNETQRTDSNQLPSLVLHPPLDTWYKGCCFIYAAFLISVQTTKIWSVNKCSVLFAGICVKPWILFVLFVLGYCFQSLAQAEGCLTIARWYI